MYNHQIVYVWEEGGEGGGGWQGCQRSLLVLGSKLTCRICAKLHRSHQHAQGRDKDKWRKKHNKTPFGGGMYLASLRVFCSVQAHIIDVSVCEVISGGGQPNVDLAR